VVGATFEERRMDMEVSFTFFFKFFLALGVLCFTGTVSYLLKNSLATDEESVHVIKMMGIGMAISASCFLASYAFKHGFSSLLLVIFILLGVSAARYGIAAVSNIRNTTNSVPR